MKKLSFLVAALAMVSMVFTSCNPKEDPTTNQLYDGFYLVGQATAVADFNASNIALAYMGAGFNEVSKEKRAGMYEKYVALEANKPFKFILHQAGKNDVSYGGTLKEQAATAEGGLAEINVYWGQLAENVEMQVPVSGLYHVVLDLNLDGQLTATGGKQIMLVPVAWGVRGGFIDANWSNTVEATSASDFNKTHMTFSFKDFVVKKDGEFKFVQADCWKIYLDMMGQVKCETSLGIENGEITTYGENINFSIERGIYDMTLTWDLKGGACGKSFTYTAKKTGTPEAEDYIPADHTVGISGSMNDWGTPAGLYLGVYNESKSEVTDQATGAGNYVYEMKGVTFEAGNTFKFRFDEDWIGPNDVEATGVTLDAVDDGFGGFNISAPAGCYDMDVTVVWDGAQRTALKVAFSEGTPGEQPTYEYVSGKIFLKNFGSLTNLHIYGWAPDKDNNHEIFGAWPGTAVGSDAKELTQIFYEKAIKDAAYKFIINEGNGGAQTADTEWSVTITGENTISLMINDENQLVLGN